MADIKSTEILDKIDFSEISSNCGCDVDRVQERASAYSSQPHNKLGSLGPWCSETIDQVRGKQNTHINITV